MKIKLTRPIVFFDLETTGLNVGKDRIIEISMIKLNVDGTREKYYSLVDPDGFPISEGAQEKHGYSNADLLGHPKFKDIAKDVYEFVKDCDLGGYNAKRFDVQVLVNELLVSGIFLNTKKVNIIDSFLIMTVMEPRTLEGAYKYYTGNKLEGAHSAEVDIEATLEIFEKQIDKYEDLPSTMDEISDLTIRDRKKTVDLAGRFIQDDKGNICFNFGKHKDKTVFEVFKEDANYFNWMIDKADFPLETKYIATKIIKKLRELQG